MPLHEKSPQASWAEAATVALASAGLGPVEWVAETGSTNADLLDAATRGAPGGRILVADHQTSGRGRRDRTWTTAAGDALLVSILLRPTLATEALPVLTAALGVAAAEACAELVSADVRLKWPNDLVVGPAGAQRKLAGILAQSQFLGPDVAVVVGLGLNVVGARLGDVAAGAIALDELAVPPARVDLLVAVFSRFARWLAVAQSSDASSLWSAYRKRSATLGQRVRCVLERETVEGDAVDIDPDGALLVEVGGAVRRVVTGDVISLRRLD